MDFGSALTALRLGKKVSRSGWNGQGMFVVLQRGYPDGIRINENTALAISEAVGTVCRFRPYLMLKTAQGDYCPWSVGNSDALAEDWSVVP